jgi:pimeloyl-ACP methyl ester carboxylesterase
MATFLLVQPAWLGGWCWDKVARRLRACGHDVYAPTLTGLGERAHLATPDVGLATHIDDIVSVAEFDDLDDLILVGTSSGGTVITGVANRIPGRIASLVYLDAFLPSDGQCTFDLLPPERRGVLEGLIETEGAGWLLPRLTPAPWPVIVRDIWRVTDPADTGWMLPRLRPTPLATSPSRSRLPAPMPTASTGSTSAASSNRPRSSTRRPRPRGRTRPGDLSRSTPRIFRT